jgi:hypothetical protein
MVRRNNADRSPRKRTTGQFAKASMLALALGLAGCGPDDTDLSGHGPAGDVEWPVDALGLAPGDFDGSFAPYPDAQPLTYTAQGASAAYAQDYSDAPSYTGRYADDYGYAPPEDYRDGARDDSYAMLALAAMLGGVLADSPPDYAFRYGRTQPWVWRTGDGYARYAEPVRGGYRTYYYAPGSAGPFLVRDPYYSYGYRNDRVAVIYDRHGRTIDPHRAWRQRQVAQRYYQRSAALQRAEAREQHYGVPAQLWASRRPRIVEAQQRWDRARAQQRQWQQWDRRHQTALTARWAQERVARRYAGERFDGWRTAGYSGPAPRFYQEARRDRQVARRVQAERQRVWKERRRVETIALRQRQQQVVRQRQAARQQQVRNMQHVREIQQVRAAQAQQVQARQLQARQAQALRAQQVRARTVQAQRAQARQAMQQARRAQQAKAQHTQARRTQQVNAQQARVEQAKHEQARRAQQAQEQQARAAQRRQAQQQRAVQARRAQARQTMQQARVEEARQAQVRRAQQTQAQQAQAAQMRQAQQQRAVQAQRAQARQAMQQARMAQAQQRGRIGREPRGAR